MRISSEREGKAFSLGVDKTWGTQWRILLPTLWPTPWPTGDQFVKTRLSIAVNQRKQLALSV